MFFLPCGLYDFYLSIERPAFFRRETVRWHPYSAGCVVVTRAAAFIAVVVIKRSDSSSPPAVGKFGTQPFVYVRSALHGLVHPPKNQFCAALSAAK